MEDMIALSSSLHAAKLESQVSIAVARKALDMQEEHGAAMIELLQAAANAGQTASGGDGLDLYA